MTDLIYSSKIPIDQKLCFALYSTSRALIKACAPMLAELGLTYPQYLAMRALWEKDGMCVQEIADQLELEGATMSPLIQRLEKRELVHKKRSVEDERIQQVFLTEKGKMLHLDSLMVPQKQGADPEMAHQQAQKVLDEVKKLRALLPV